MSDLDEKLGNLCGQLDRLIPSLEKVEDRLEATRDRVLLSEERLIEVQKSIDYLKRQRKGESERRWDVAKIVLQVIATASVAAIVAWLTRGL